MLGGVAALFMECGERVRRKEWPGVVGVFLGALLAAALWLGAVGYSGYRTFVAIP